MKDLKDLRAENICELLDWLNQECPAVAPPLEPYTTADLSHDFCEGLRLRLNAIAELEAELEVGKEPKKKPRESSIKICAGCGSFAHGNPGHDITI